MLPTIHVQHSISIDLEIMELVTIIASLTCNSLLSEGLVFTLLYLFTPMPINHLQNPAFQPLITK